MIADGVVHVVERITDEARIASITAILAADDVLIADGHHRYAISRTYRDEVRAATGRTDTDAEFTLTFINELVADQLSIEAIHRIYTDICVEELRAVLAGSLRPRARPRAHPGAAGRDGRLGTPRAALPRRLRRVADPQAWGLRRRPARSTGPTSNTPCPGRAPR